MKTKEAKKRMRWAYNQYIPDHAAGWCRCFISNLYDQGKISWRQCFKLWDYDVKLYWKKKALIFGENNQGMERL